MNASKHNSVGSDETDIVAAVGVVVDSDSERMTIRKE